jgi:ATP-dependent helicase/nuclease subunit A
MDERTSSAVLPDIAARRTALTALDRSLLVEAGAGSGKTSLMAGRVAFLLASGAAPKNIAAITFTEFAASELLIRVDGFVRALREGVVPNDLAIAFPQGLGTEQRRNLEAAAATLDQLTCTTIHGFAKALIRPYPVEAEMDPGADIVDPAEADLAFAERYDAWIKARLSKEEGDGIVAELVLADETQGLALIGNLATFRRSNRDACPESGRWKRTSVSEFLKTVKAFGDVLARSRFDEAATEETSKAFTSVGRALAGSDVDQDEPSTAIMIEVLMLPRPEVCFTQAGGPRKLRTKGRYRTAAAATGKSAIDGEAAFDRANSAYEACHEAFAGLSAAAAGEILARLFASMDGLMEEWREYKRSSALLDFDDLLYTARDLLKEHEPVRRALASRYRHVLVDEFHDTDPLQIEILWRLCGEAGDSGIQDPLACTLRPGALFLVGDPKQAIYRFRGADVNAYLAARESMGEAALLEITTNFRSVKPILDFVNARFKAPLLMPRQPGFAELAAVCDVPPKAPSVAAIDVTHDEKPTAEMFRDAEATRVAELCRELVGVWPVRCPRTKQIRPCELGDIALLAPVGTELWRFEEALEDLGMPVSTQAGKNFFRRQEIHDLIALARTLADARDTLALGALLRGPLVGLTETELLDIAEGLPVNPEHPDRLPQLRLWTSPDDIRHPLAHSVLETLQGLGRRSRSTTPYILLADAIEALNIRAQLRQRYTASADRALANVDFFLEMARAYDVRGLRAFARDMGANWKEAVRQVEGRPDAEQQSVALITIHAAKGLEWPIVIPVNTTGTPLNETGIVHDRRRGKFSTCVLGVEPPRYRTLKNWSEEEQAREHVRLWYVAATRARDLLVLPRHSVALPDRCWMKIVDLELPSLPALDLRSVAETRRRPPDAPENRQTEAIFVAEAERIVQAQKKITWHRPSRGEVDAIDGAGPAAVFTAADLTEAPSEIPTLDIVGGPTRGTILHKLMEEALTGETRDDVPSLAARATELLSQLGVIATSDPKLGLAPIELAATVARTLQLPEITRLRPRLIPETTVFGSLKSTDSEVLVSGIADATSADTDGHIEDVIDWKSDIEPTTATLNAYREQLAVYRKTLEASRGLLALMTKGIVLEFK